MIEAADNSSKELERSREVGRFFWLEPWKCQPLRRSSWSGENLWNAYLEWICLYRRTRRWGQTQQISELGQHGRIMHFSPKLSQNVWKLGKRDFNFRVVHWLSGKEFTCQCRRHRFNLRVGKIPWRRKWQPTPALLSGKSQRQRSLVGYSPWDHKETDKTEWLAYASFKLRIRRKQSKGASKREARKDGW